MILSSWNDKAIFSAFYEPALEIYFWEMKSRPFLQPKVEAVTKGKEIPKGGDLGSFLTFTQGEKQMFQDILVE